MVLLRVPTDLPGVSRLAAALLANLSIAAKSARINASPPELQRPIRWNKHAHNNWLRMAGPSFDNSVDRKSTRLNSSHLRLSRMPSSA